MGTYKPVKEYVSYMPCRCRLDLWYRGFIISVLKNEDIGFAFAEIRNDGKIISLARISIEDYDTHLARHFEQLDEVRGRSDIKRFTRYGYDIEETTQFEEALNSMKSVTWVDESKFLHH